MEGVGENTVLTEVVPNSMRVLPASHLEGEVVVPGDKVAAVHLSLATAVVGAESKINNPHYCGDVVRIYDWLSFAGLVTVDRQQDSVRITPNKAPEVVDLSDLSDTRSNVCLVTPLALSGSTVTFKGTAGCGFTDRKVDKHFELMEVFGLSIDEKDGLYEITHKGSRRSVDFDCATASGIPSVGVTCHAIMAALACESDIILRNVALEAASATLIGYAQKSMNRSVSLEGRTLKLSAVHTIKHQPTEIVLPPDVTVASTYIAALTAAGSGELLLQGATPSSLPDALRDTYEGMSVHIRQVGTMATSVAVERGQIIVPKAVRCEVWPGFPTDVAPMFAASIAGYAGESKIIDDIYDKRSSHVGGLNEMGYELAAAGNTTVIHGRAPQRLGNVAVEALDIRCGAALVVGALGSNVESVTIRQYRQVYRGYANFSECLRGVGAELEGA